jgi:hypothetical protein
MNGGLHTKRLTDEQLSFKSPRAATIKIRYAPSKSVSVVADTQTHPAHYCHTLAFPTRHGFVRRFVSSLKFGFTIVLWTTWFTLKAQVIPDLVTGDNYRPYLTEDQKRQEIFKAPKSKTSQELYPDLYKYQNQNQDNLDKLIKQGLIPDPNATFQNQAKIGFNSTATPTAQQTTYGIPKGVYEPGLTIQQRNQMMIEADMAAYETQKRQQEQLVSQALNEFGPTINYNLGVHSKGVDRFIKAFSELQGMLNGTQKIDFLKAVYLVESSHDVSLTWEEFNKMFQSNLQIIMQLMKQDKLSPTDNLSKIMATYKFMADTTSVYMAAKEKNVVSKPMLYDFEDFAGKQDITKVFVSKLLRTGTGQCMSLPMLYYLFAKALGAEVNLAFAPQHSYIMFKDKENVWQNIELTGRIFTTNDFNWQSGFIKMEQVKSGIYMRPISEKETIAHLLTTLAITYARTFGTDDRVLEMALVANEHAPNDITSNMIMTGYANELWKNVQRQYQVYNLPVVQLTNDERAQEIKQTRDNLLNHLYKDLGWSKIPDAAYKQWLDGVNELALKRQHIVRRRQLEQQLNR